MAWQVCIRKDGKLLAIDTDGNPVSQSGNPPWEILDKASAEAFVQQNKEDGITDWMVVQVPKSLTQAEHALRELTQDKKTSIAGLVKWVFQHPPQCGNDVMKLVRVLTGEPNDSSEILTG